MAIAEMLRVAVVGLTDDADKTSEILQKHGCVQIEAITEEGHTKRLSDGTNLQDRAMKAEELAIDLKAALDFMDRQKQVKKGMLDTFIGWHYRIGEDEYLKHVAGGETRAREISELARQSEGLLNNIANEIKAIDSKVEALRPWTSIEIPTADFLRLKHHSFYFLSADAVKGLKSLDEALKGLEEPAAYQELSRDDRKVYGIIAVNKADAQKCLQLLAQEGYDAAEMMDSTLPPAMEIKKLEGRKAELLKAQETAKQGALKLCDLRPEAFSLYDHYANEKTRYETAGGFLATETSFALEGWVRKDLLQGLQKELGQKVASAVVISRKPEEGEDVPVDLINKGIFSPFESVTRIMGLPRQGSVDPTPLLAVFFFIYFGTCMGDAIYGIIMTALGSIPAQEDQDRRHGNAAAAALSRGRHRDHFDGSAVRRLLRRPVHKVSEAVVVRPDEPQWPATLPGLLLWNGRSADILRNGHQGLGQRTQRQMALRNIRPGLLGGASAGSWASNRRRGSWSRILNNRQMVVNSGRRRAGADSGQAP